MTPKLDDFRQHYESLSDAALLEIRRDDLVEEARACYDVELARRGLKPTRERTEDEAQDVEQVQGGVIVATFGLREEAKLAEGLLRSVSIPCALRGDRSVRLYSFDQEDVGGLRLEVPAAFAEQAKEILASSVSELDLEAQAEAASTEDEPELPNESSF